MLLERVEAVPEFGSMQTSCYPQLKNTYYMMSKENKLAVNGLVGVKRQNEIKEERHGNLLLRCILSLNTISIFPLNLGEQLKHMFYTNLFLLCISSS